MLLSLSSSPASSSSLPLLLSGVMFCMFFLFCFLRNVLHWFLVEVFIVITQDCVVDGEPGTYYFRLYDPLNVPRRKRRFSNRPPHSCYSQTERVLFCVLALQAPKGTAPGIVPQNFMERTDMDYFSKLCHMKMFVFH